MANQHSWVSLGGLLLLTPQLIFGRLDRGVVLALDLLVVSVLQILLLVPEVLALLLHRSLKLLVFLNIQVSQMIFFHFSQVLKLFFIQQIVSYFFFLLTSLNMFFQLFVTLLTHVILLHRSFLSFRKSFSLQILDLFFMLMFNFLLLFQL